jgi:hypothetical protein
MPDLTVFLAYVPGDSASTLLAPTVARHLAVDDAIAQVDTAGFAAFAALNQVARVAVVDE